MVSKADMAKLMGEIFADCDKFRDAGQAEYAHADDNALANFERVAEQTGTTREQVLMVYLSKHMDGIHAHIKGHRSQRESVHGRVRDAIVYLCLFDAMVLDEEESNRIINAVPR